MINFTSSSIAPRTTNAKKVPAELRPTLVQVTVGTLAQVLRKGHNQACLTITGKDAEALSEHRGDVTITIGDKSYTVTKTDSHCAWASKQGSNLGDFSALFNRLVVEDNGTHKPTSPLRCSMKA